MDIPYGFDCYSFGQNEIKYFESNILRAYSAGAIPYNASISASTAHQGYLDPSSGKQLGGYVRFTRKDEHYTDEQVGELIRAGKLKNKTDLAPGRKLFCGIKIQIGIAVITNFLHKGMQYRRPIKGRSDFINGTWTGIVSGLTDNPSAPTSYDMAFGNFLAYDEEFPYMKFGPFFAVESKLVMLTGSSRRIEASSFGTNIDAKIWFTVLSAMLILSLLASARVHWQRTKHLAMEAAIEHLLARYREPSLPEIQVNQLCVDSDEQVDREKPPSLIRMMQDFFFIYFTMLLNKPCLEFDNLVWPSHHLYHGRRVRLQKWHRLKSMNEIDRLLRENEALRLHYNEMMEGRNKRKPLPTSIRVISYLWSAACLVMTSIYSGEMLAVMLLHADQNIDTIQQLLAAKPPIEPVIRQDDFTYNLMLKSLDRNMLLLHNRTKFIPRQEVYTRDFIERVSKRKLALLGDDELIETIYDIYHKYFPLHRSQVAYLQYPISIMYRKDLNVNLESKLRRGIVQLFEMGLIHRWYMAQKETYIHLYDKYEKKDHNPDSDDLSASSEQKYKPLTMRNFHYFFQVMGLCFLFATLVLILETAHYRLKNVSAGIRPIKTC